MKKIDEQAKWRKGVHASGHAPGEKHSLGTGPVGGTFINEPSGYDGETKKFPVDKYRSRPDQLADRSDLKLSTTGKPLLPKNAQRNLKGAIKQSKGKHGPVGALPEGRFVKGPGGVPLDRQGNEIPPKEVAPKMARVAKPKTDYDKIWFDVTNIISNIFPDGDPADYLLKYCRKHGLTYDDIRKAARKNGYKDEYEYIDQMKTGDYGYEEPVREQVAEGYYATGRKSSYSDAVPQVKIILQHSRQLEEGERRYRAIDRIFVENAAGERFLLDTKKPGLARVYARHIAEGGTPYDEQGKHIHSLVEEYTKMAGFVRATRNGQFNESTQSLVNEGINHYNNLREQLHKMSGHRGYTAYFESWAPTLTEDEDTTDLSEMFASNELDPRIESVMPILRKLNKTISEMSETSELESWADDLIEESLGMMEGDGLEALNAEGIPEDSTHKGGTVVRKNGVTKHTSGPGVYGGFDADTGPDSPDVVHTDIRGAKVGHKPWDRDTGEYITKKKVKEELGPEQKKVGQAGPTDPAPLRGKLVGACESVEEGTLTEDSPLGALGFSKEFINSVYRKFGIANTEIPEPMSKKPTVAEFGNFVFLSKTNSGKAFAAGLGNSGGWDKPWARVIIDNEGTIEQNNMPASKALAQIGKGQYYAIPFQHGSYARTRNNQGTTQYKRANPGPHDYSSDQGAGEYLQRVEEVFGDRIRQEMTKVVEHVYANLRKFKTEPRGYNQGTEQTAALEVANKLDKLSKLPLNQQKEGYSGSYLERYLQSLGKLSHGFGSIPSNYSAFVKEMDTTPNGLAKFAKFILSTVHYYEKYVDDMLNKGQQGVAEGTGGRSEWDPNSSGYQGDYGGEDNWGKHERDDERHDLDQATFQLSMDGDVLPKTYSSKELARFAGQALLKQNPGAVVMLKTVSGLAEAKTWTNNMGDKQTYYDHDKPKKPDFAAKFKKNLDKTKKQADDTEDKIKQHTEKKPVKEGDQGLAAIKRLLGK